MYLKRDLLRVLLGGLVIASTSISAHAFSEYSIKYNMSGLVKKASQDIPQNESIYRFRHVDHDSEGWADVIIAPVSSPIKVVDEVTYRQAAQNAGGEAYFTIPDTIRCTHQDFGNLVVPEVDYGCNSWGITGP